MPIPFVWSVKNQSKLLRSLPGGDQYLARAMFCLKPFDCNDFSLKLAKYFMFPNRYFCASKATLRMLLLGESKGGEQSY